MLLEDRMMSYHRKHKGNRLEKNLTFLLIYKEYSFFIMLFSITYAGKPLFFCLPLELSIFSHIRSVYSRSKSWGLLMTNHTDETCGCWSHFSCLCFCFLISNCGILFIRQCCSFQLLGRNHQLNQVTNSSQFWEYSSEHPPAPTPHRLLGLIESHNIELSSSCHLPLQSHK